MKKNVLARILAGVILVNSMSFSPLAVAADTKVLNNENSCAGAWGSSSSMFEGPATKFVSPSAATITSITLNYSTSSGANSPTAASGQKIAIWTNSGSLPTTLVGKMSYSSYTGTQVTFVGSISLPTGGTYWLQIMSNFPAYFCYVSAQSNAGSTAGWSTQVGLTYGSAGSGETATAFTAFTGSLTTYTFAYSLYTRGPETVNVSAFNSQLAEKGRVDTLTATTSFSGKVTFFANGKKIPNCINIVVLSTTGTCLWKPAVTGSARIYAYFLPTGNAATTSSSFNVKIQNRTTTR
jgi:hypothetical protein